ncbi:MAG: Uma2 family endonuclease [Halothece sp.]
MYQTDPPLSPKETLPTMYDLPSEDPEESGLPDEFHNLQPQLLRETFQPLTYSTEEIFIGTDLNLYYDVHHPLWYKRPDWFAVVGVSRFYEAQDLRLSYVIWQEGVSPLVVVELLSPGTEKEDLGQTPLTSPLIWGNEGGQPPTKWEVYERILRIPYYVVFNRYTDELQVFALQGERYQELNLEGRQFWIPSVELGLGVWQGTYDGINRQWLRWFDANGNWMPTLAEQREQERERANQQQQQVEQEKQRAEQEKQRAEQEKQRAERLAKKLRELGIDPDTLS